MDGEPHEIRASQINAYLVDAPWILLDNEATNLCGMPEMMYGSKPTDGGHFLFTDGEKTEFLLKEPAAAVLVKPFVSAHEYLHGKNRWVLWLANAAPAQTGLPEVRKRVNAVAKFRQASKAQTTQDYPYPALFRQVTQPRTDYILIPGHSSEFRAFIPLGMFDKDHIVGNSCFALPGATLFHFGVMQSTMHMAWMRATCGRLKGDYRYSKDIVYNNFPWPNSTPSQEAAIRAAGQGILDARALFPATPLADLYDAATMPTALVRAHRVLDRVVDAAYGRKSFAAEADRVALLFKRHQALAAPFDTTPSLKGRRRKAGTLPRRAPVSD